MQRLLIAVLISAALTSCISSHVTSNKDPFCKGGPKKRFLFVMESGTPELVKHMESFAVEHFAEKNLVAVPYTKALTPVRTYTDEEMAELLRRANVEMYVRLRNAGSNTANVHIPSVSYTQGSATAYGGNGYGSARGRSATVTSGGYSTSVVTDLNIDCSVEDATTLQTIWTGSIKIDINNNNQYIAAYDYFEKIITVLVKQMRMDGVAKM